MNQSNRLTHGNASFIASGAATLAILLGTTHASFAANSVQHLIEVTSEARPETSQFSALVNESGDLAGLTYVTPPKNPKSFSLPQLKAGVTILREESANLDIIRMKTIDRAFDAQRGGVVQITYIFDGLFHRNTVRVFNIEMVRNGSGWLVYEVTSRLQWDNQRGEYRYSRADKPFGHMKFLSNKILGKLVGISYIQTW